MKRKMIIVTVLAMLVATTAYAAPGDQTGNPGWMDQMYQYCNQMMGGSSGPDQGGKTQPQGQPMSYNGNMMMGSGMMGNGNYGNMMGSGNYGNMMGDGAYGHMMGKVEFQ